MSSSLAEKEAEGEGHFCPGIRHSSPCSYSALSPSGRGSPAPANRFSSPSSSRSSEPTSAPSFTVCSVPSRTLLLPQRFVCFVAPTISLFLFTVECYQLRPVFVEFTATEAVPRDERSKAFNHRLLFGGGGGRRNSSGVSMWQTPEGGVLAADDENSTQASRVVVLPGVVGVESSSSKIVSAEDAQNGISSEQDEQRQEEDGSPPSLSSIFRLGGTSPTGLVAPMSSYLPSRRKDEMSNEIGGEASGSIIDIFRALFGGGDSDSDGLGDSVGPASEGGDDFQLGSLDWSPQPVKPVESVRADYQLKNRGARMLGM